MQKLGRSHLLTWHPLQLPEKGECCRIYIASAIVWSIQDTRAAGQGVIVVREMKTLIMALLKKGLVGFGADRRRE